MNECMNLNQLYTKRVPLKSFFLKLKLLLLFCLLRSLHIGQLSDEYKLTVTMDAGCVLLKDTNTVYDETNTEIYTIKKGEPSTAKVAIQGQVTMKREGESADQENSAHHPWDTKVQASSEMWADEQLFYVDSHLTAWHGCEACFDRTWTKKIERFHV